MMAMTSSAYSSIFQLSADKPALVFVPGRKQVRTTALDLLSACILDDDDDRFLHISTEELKPFMEQVHKCALADSLSHGIGYYHEALSTNDKRIVSHLFKIGAIQVMLASRDVCWEINFTDHLVIVMGTEYYEGREH